MPENAERWFIRHKLFMAFFLTIIGFIVTFAGVVRVYDNYATIPARVEAVEGQVKDFQDDFRGWICRDIAREEERHGEDCLYLMSPATQSVIRDMRRRPR